MTGSPKHIMRIVIIALLFQFVSPAFFAVITQGADIRENDRATIHTPHSSIVIPQLLKEKDETEKNDDDFTINLVALIDFTHHSFVLTKSHESKFTPFVFHDRIDHHPPLFTLHRTFLI